MDNMYEPPGGDPAEESRPTEQFWPMSHQPDASHGPRYQPHGYQDPLPGRVPGAPTAARAVSRGDATR